MTHARISGRTNTWVLSVSELPERSMNHSARQRNGPNSLDGMEREIMDESEREMKQN
jgi:hypothetical protein